MYKGEVGEEEEEVRGTCCMICTCSNARTHIHTHTHTQEVVEAINEFAFVTSEYPVILSIENHCKSRANLIQRMTNIFVTTFGDKLVKSTIDGYPVS